jgi:hypothetical protein
MIMAISSVVATPVAAMSNPVTRTGRVTKVGSGRSNPTSTTATETIQSTSRPQPVEMPRTVEQVRAAFEFARLALNNATTSGGAIAQPSPDQSHSMGSNQVGNTYTQPELPVGQVLDLTA